MPSITIQDDSSIIEGTENGKVITVTLSDGAFVNAINPNSYHLENLPSGLSKGLVTRTSSNEVTIVLTGNRTVDYDIDITNLQVAVEDNQIAGYTGIPLVVNTGVVFKASNPIMTLTNPTNQANRSYPLSAGKIIAFKLNSTVDSTVNLEVRRIGGGEPTFGNLKVYIDLNDDGNIDPNEEITADGVGGTINNGMAPTISYSGQGTYLAKAVISGLNLTISQMAHDIMVVGDMDTGGQLAIGQYYGLAAKKTSDLIENLNISGSLIR